MSALSGSNKAPTRLLLVHVVFIVLIAAGTLMRVHQCFAVNPLDHLVCDTQMHYDQALDVKCKDIETILLPVGFQIFLQTLLRITGSNHFLVACAMSVLSVITPYFYYRWLREATRDKTISLFGYALFTYLPSYFRIFSFFMDSVLLLPLTAASLWLTWRAARKCTWKSCIEAAVVCGMAVCTKLTAVPIVVLPWVYVAWKLAQRMSRRQTTRIVAASLSIIAAFYSLGPLKVWTHTGAIVLVPDRYLARYFESGAREIQVTHKFNTLADGGYWVLTYVWCASCVAWPSFYPFNKELSDRQGRTVCEIDYTAGYDKLTPPMNVNLLDRIRYTMENIKFFFFQYEWPDDAGDFDAPFPRNLLVAFRFVWCPLTLLLFAWIIGWRRREFAGWYFIAVTLAFMLQQSGLMEGRYRKPWDGLAVGTLVYLLAGSRLYKRVRSWTDEPLVASAPVAAAASGAAAGAGAQHTAVSDALPSVSSAPQSDTPAEPDAQAATTSSSS